MAWSKKYKKSGKNKFKKTEEEMLCNECLGLAKPMKKIEVYENGEAMYDIIVCEKCFKKLKKGKGRKR